MQQMQLRIVALMLMGGAGGVLSGPPAAEAEATGSIADLLSSITGLEI